MTQLTDDDIKAIARQARGSVGSIAGNCRTISKRVQQLSQREYGVHMDIVETQVGEIRDTHFINKLSSTDYAHTSTGPIIVDASVDQFCTENQHRDGIRVDFGSQEYLPEVAIYPPGEVERHIWYYKPNDPREGYDIFTDEEYDE